MVDWWNVSGNLLWMIVSEKQIDRLSEEYFGVNGVGGGFFEGVFYLCKILFGRSD